MIVEVVVDAVPAGTRRCSRIRQAPDLPPIVVGKQQDHVVDSIRKLGFDPDDIRYLIIGQAHADHLGAAKVIQEMGARVGMGEADWTFMEETAAAGRLRADPPKRDLVIRDGDTLTIHACTQAPAMDRDEVKAEGFTRVTWAIEPVASICGSNAARAWGLLSSVACRCAAASRSVGSLRRASP